MRERSRIVLHRPAARGRRGNGAMPTTTRGFLPFRSVVRQAAVAIGASIVAAWSTVYSGESLGAVTELISVNRSTGNAAGLSLDPTISGDGRYVAFASGSTKLVPGDTNAADDIFVRDRQTGRIERVSLSSSGLQADRFSILPAISANGRYVAFVSYATNLALPVDRMPHTYVHDRLTGVTERVGFSNDARYRPSLSADGRYVILGSWALRPREQMYFSVYVWDRLLGHALERVATNHASWPKSPVISGNGRYVAYEGYVVVGGALVVGVYIYDRFTGLTRRVDRNSNEEPGNLPGSEPSISYDGRYVAFTSSATNLAVSDSNGATDVFVRDREAGTTTRVSVGPGARQADGNSYRPAISANGLRVAFVSDAGNLTSYDQNGVADIFLRDWQAGVTQLLSVDSNGQQGNRASESPAINAGGRYVAFASSASDLVSNDLNTSSDVFVRDRGGVLP